MRATPDGNLTITLGPGASEGKVRFTATVDWPVHLQAIRPADLLLAPSQRHTEIAKTPQVAQVRASSPWARLTGRPANVHCMQISSRRSKGHAGLDSLCPGFVTIPQSLSSQVSFLMYPPQKLLAGSWRFLTYFGRHVDWKKRALEVELRRFRESMPWNPEEQRIRTHSPISPCMQG